MEVCKTAGWYRNVRSLKVYMAVNLTSLTRQAGAGPGCDISTHVRPTETTTDQAAGGTNTRMADAVKMEKNLLPEGGRHKRAENAGGNVPEDLNTFNYLGDHTEARQQFHGGNIWAS